jgi:rare lipoprotein A (peptidoglycan hydrolase)
MTTLVVAMMMVAACQHSYVKHPRHKANPVSAEADDADGDRYVAEGVASWYGPGFHGRKTASGKRFNTHKLTAAHRTLPFGTKVLVTNLSNDKCVEVEINDRGPAKKTRRLIDLSKAAAKKLGFASAGVTKVRVEVVEKEKSDG